MNSQFEFSFGFARSGDPATAHDAAASVNATRLEQVVLDALMQLGPKTSFELADALGLSLVTVSPRLRPLADKGLVEDSGQVKVNPSGRKSIVWRVRRHG